MGNGGDGRQAAERPPGEGGVRLRVRDRLGFLIYIYHAYWAGLTPFGLGLVSFGRVRVHPRVEIKIRTRTRKLRVRVHPRVYFGIRTRTHRVQNPRVPSLIV